jgi:hypothetical protein
MVRRPDNQKIREGTEFAKNVEFVTTDTLGIAGFETVEKDGEIDLGVSAPKATYTINNPGADAYLIHVVDWDGGGGARLGLRPNDYGAGSGEDTYRWQNTFGQDTSNDTSWSIGSQGSSQDRFVFGRFLIRRTGGRNYIGFGRLGGWSNAPVRCATHGNIGEGDPINGEITSFTFVERQGNDLTGGTARIARVLFG